jgi:hypothetical protein
MKTRKLIPVVAVLFAAFLLSAPTQVQLLPSPVANFSFNNTYADATGTLGNATAYGT